MDDHDSHDNTYRVYRQDSITEHLETNKLEGNGIIYGGLYFICVIGPSRPGFFPFGHNQDYVAYLIEAAWMRSGRTCRCNK